ncbi:hypothetical protein [Sphingobacterium composti Ten et al. 2007 non Yoo et al. 2007]|uniref:hypothetical protein n=1 Tax=Sphingobacterium composti TaxID=363260 RepID=UPI00135B523E|nr:hypothetical protein [Sphingobacterium composti Ten et al. 2007 non Yoo et al. 2007]
MTNNFKDIITEENLLLAGTKVVDKSGGPIMLIVGFSSDTNEVINQKFKPKKFIRQKVFVNKDRKSITELTNGRIVYNKRYTYFFYTDIFSEMIINSYSLGADILYIICKYWSDKDNEFLYIYKTLPELEAI